jgi:hypothetical protein
MYTALTRADATYKDGNLVTADYLVRLIAADAARDERPAELA